MKNIFILILFIWLVVGILMALSGNDAQNKRLDKLEETNKLACVDVVMSGHALPEYCKQYFTNQK